MLLNFFRRLIRDERGNNALEYTLVASLIAIAAITAMKTVGAKVSNIMANISNTLG